MSEHNTFLPHLLPPLHEHSIPSIDCNDSPRSFDTLLSKTEVNEHAQHSEDTHFTIQILQPDVSLHNSPSFTLNQRNFIQSISISNESNNMNSSPRSSAHSSCSKYSFLFPPLIRFVFACTFFFTSSFLTRFITMHILVPSVDLTQTPLHDILLDRISSPFPEAFKITECITAVLAFLMVLLSCFNRTHRFNILARFLLLDGVLLILRIIVMSSTILSIPNANDVTKCHTLQQMPLKERLFGTSASKNEQETTVIGYTCGDYMFSGHTCAVTLCTFFVLYYSSTTYSFQSSSSRIGRRIWLGMRIVVVCVLISGCIMGLFCIVWSKEHYTADVVVACLLTVLLCMLYHYQLHLYCQVKAMKLQSMNEEEHSTSLENNVCKEKKRSSSNPLNWLTCWFFSWFEYDMTYEELLKSNEFDLKPLEWIGKVWKYIQSLFFRGMIPHQEEEIGNS
ncbi:hypothetical protein C9374_008748 [Naegleria lovaniensis]|uniref:Sphingomyelin synthase-like domain-containing protein n=1 Tax=Naegleria lovaniensis TaxID=51637 RepID=A0AA88GKH9_NAELO|nr:uncharacterized protein C9374_008748 [Naegleria lovaniensis]KAG2378126.1 hypothetical protein C9374_008748 [Naegleria lovaniensis]